MSIDIDIKLKKPSKVFREGELIVGVVSLKSNTDFKHDGITLTAEGKVNLQLSSKSVGIIEAFYQSVKPIQLLHTVIEVAAPGKIPAGKTDIPFEFVLKPKGNKTLFETYHGVFVSIQYNLHVEMKRPFLAKDLAKTCELIVEYNPNSCEKANPHPVPFSVTKESLRNVRDERSVPKRTSALHQTWKWLHQTIALHDHLIQLTASARTN